MTKYKVMIKRVFGYGFFSESYIDEFSGHLFNTREEARNEYLDALKSAGPDGDAYIVEMEVDA